MATLRVITTDGTFSVSVAPSESVLEAARRVNLSAHAFIFLDGADHPVSMSYQPKEDETVNAYGLRNATMRVLDPRYAVVQPTSGNFAVDVITETTDRSGRILLQLTTADALAVAKASFFQVMNQYLGSNPKQEVQIALSAGGDSRVVAECAAAWREAQGTTFSAVITALGFENGPQHIEHATRIAESFQLPYEVFDEQTAASLLGYSADLRTMGESYRMEFPDDDVEIIGTHWLELVNREAAARRGRQAIIFGYNQEDVIADHLYNVLLARTLPHYPVRTVRDITYLAPLAFVPKRLLDSLDIENSLRNYRQRVESRSYTRGAIYHLAYHLTERFPLLASAFAGAGLIDGEGSPIERWLAVYRTALA